jgi:hypothetical protein
VVSTSLLAPIHGFARWAGAWFSNIALIFCILTTGQN